MGFNIMLYKLTPDNHERLPHKVWDSCRMTCDHFFLSVFHSDAVRLMRVNRYDDYYERPLRPEDYNFIQEAIKRCPDMLPGEAIRLHRLLDLMAVNSNIYLYVSR